MTLAWRSLRWLVPVILISCGGVVHTDSTTTTGSGAGGTAGAAGTGGGGGITGTGGGASGAAGGGGVPSDLRACTLPTDCAVVGLGCCGGCEPVMADSLTAINRSQVEAFRQTQCNATCGACAPSDPLEATSQYFIATCNAGQCALLDLRQSDLLACKDASDCTLRPGSQCCMLCGSTSVLPLNKSVNFSELVCSPHMPRCPPCIGAVDYTEFQPTCENGRCRAVRAPDAQAP